MEKEVFAKTFGFESYEDLIDHSREVHTEGDISWYVTGCPDGKWAAWDEAEISRDRVEVFNTEEEAREFLQLGWGFRNPM